MVERDENCDKSNNKQSYVMLNPLSPIITNEKKSLNMNIDLNLIQNLIPEKSQAFVKKINNNDNIKPKREFHTFTKSK